MSKDTISPGEEMEGFCFCRHFFQPRSPQHFMQIIDKATKTSVGLLRLLPDNLPFYPYYNDGRRLNNNVSIKATATTEDEEEDAGGLR